MPHNLITRTPVDNQYVSLVGKAIYIFAYYEWAIINLITKFNPTFIQRYTRGNPMTSGQVKRELESIINSPSTNFTILSQDKLQTCHDRFENLINKRNALIHAHPITDHDGSQILSYQTRSDRELPDMKWPIAEVQQLIREFDNAVCETVVLLE